MLRSVYSLHIVPSFFYEPSWVDTREVRWEQSARARGIMHLGIGLGMASFVVSLGIISIPPRPWDAIVLGMWAFLFVVAAIGLVIAVNGIRDLSRVVSISVTKGSGAVRVTSGLSGKRAADGLVCHPVVVGAWSGFVVGVRRDDDIFALASASSVEQIEAHAERLAQLTGLRVVRHDEVVQGRAM